MTWARLLAGAAAAAGVWMALGPLVLPGAPRLPLPSAGPLATGATLVLCAAGVASLSRGREAGARVAGLLVLLLTIVGSLVSAPAIVATTPGLHALGPGDAPRLDRQRLRPGPDGLRHRPVHPAPQRVAAAP